MTLILYTLYLKTETTPENVRENMTKMCNVIYASVHSAVRIHEAQRNSKGANLAEKNALMLNGAHIVMSLNEIITGTNRQNLRETQFCGRNICKH